MDVDWGPVAVRSRAADTMGSHTPEHEPPAPVVVRTSDGQHALGDPTRWGGSDGPVRLADVPGEVRLIPTQQLVRAQVQDHRARHWRWQIQIRLEAVPGAIFPNLETVLVEWSVGTGQTSVTQRYNLALLAALSAAIGWEPVAEGGSVTVWVQSVPGLTDVLGEAVSARLIFRMDPSGETPGAVDAFATMTIQPGEGGQL